MRNSIPAAAELRGCKRMYHPHGIDLARLGDHGIHSPIEDYFASSVSLVV